MAHAVTGDRARAVRVQELTGVAIVTGAARGIGAATVRRLSHDGWAIVAIDRCADDPSLGYELATEQDLQELVDWCDHPELVFPVIADVRDQLALDRAVMVAVRKFGRLDAAVAVAGMMLGGPPLWEMSEAAYQLTVDVNLTGVWRLVKAAVPALLARPEPRHGRFVAVASAAAHHGMPRLAAYGAAKAGVAGLVRGLAADLAGSGITANAVAPGPTSTTMLDVTAEIYDYANVDDFAHNPLHGRLLHPDEIAAPIAWLCSRESSSLTGHVLPTDAGLTT
ncbi:MAG: mycofactocin-coupled SDR family oxidoreductase [Solirubrobacteraceae bacterium]|jgi:SDR family mycofactocin-dependent oxidoreductase